MAQRVAAPIPDHVTERTLLLVSVAFPPSTEVGAARWEGFAPFLSNEGWTLDVLMQTPPGNAPVDMSRVERLGEHVAVSMVPKVDPLWRAPALRLASMLRGRAVDKATSADEAPIRTVVADGIAPGAGRMLAPNELFAAVVAASSSRRWIRDVVESSDALATRRVPAIVVSSGPPHDAHVAAHRIAQQHRVPHVVDLRDPWIANPADRSSHSAIFGSPTSARVEERVLRDCAAVLSNTPQAADALVRRCSWLSGRVHAILNGSDRVPRPARILGAEEPFLIVHAGTLYLDRDPRPFLRGLAAARTGLGDLADRLRVVFMGHRASVGGRSLPEWASEYGLADCFEERGFGSRDEAAALMNSASMLVAFQGATPTQIPAKIFEYVGNAATLLAVTDANSATASILAGTTARVVGMHDERGICDVVTDAVRSAIGGTPITPADHDGRFARSTQAAALLAILDTL